MRTTKDFETALAAAKAAPFQRARAYGCGRAYVKISGLQKGEVRSLSVAAKNVGLMFLKKAYGTTGNVLYVGYDNADGGALGQAEAIAAVLNKHGVLAYADAVAD